MKQRVLVIIGSLIMALACSVTTAIGRQTVKVVSIEEAIDRLEASIREETYRADDSKERGYRLIQQMQKSKCARDSAVCQISQRECISRWVNAYAASGETLDPEDVKWSCQRRSTRYEVPGLYNLLTESLADLQRASDGSNLKIPEISVGTLGIAGINASAQTAGAQHDHIILVRHEFLKFSRQMTGISAAALSIVTTQGGEVINDDPSDIEDRLDDEPKLIEAFQSGINEYTGGKTVNVALPPTSPIRENAAAITADGVRLFVIAHEIGHIVKNHTTSSPSKAWGLSGEALDLPKNLQATDPSWAEELEADVVGLRLFSVAVERSGDTVATKGLKLYGPSYYFLLRQVLAAYDSSGDRIDLRPEEEGALVTLSKCLDDSACDLVSFVSKTASTLFAIKGHPSPRFRREVAEYILKTGEESATSYVGHMMNQTVLRLWRRALGMAYR